MRKILYWILILAGLFATVYFSVDTANNNSMDDFFYFKIRNGVQEWNGEALNIRIEKDTIIQVLSFDEISSMQSAEKEKYYKDLDKQKYLNVENNEIYIEKPMRFHICYEEQQLKHKINFDNFSFRFINIDNSTIYISTVLPEQKTYTRSWIAGSKVFGIVLSEIDIKTHGWYKIECAGTLKTNGQTMLMANSRMPYFDGGNVVAMNIKGNLAASIVCLIVSGLFLITVIILFIRKRKQK